MHLLFLHGLESGPIGTKSLALRARWPGLIAPDCEGVLDLPERVAKVRAVVDGLDGPCVLVGSSFGGLVALHIAHDTATGKVAGLVLCAPAVHVDPAHVPAGAAMPCVVIHGRDDTIVPLSAARRWAADAGCTLIETADGHRLVGSLERIVGETAGLLARLEAS